VDVQVIQDGPDDPRRGMALRGEVFHLPGGLERSRRRGGNRREELPFEQPLPAGGRRILLPFQRHELRRGDAEARVGQRLFRGHVSWWNSPVVASSAAYAKGAAKRTAAR
jgi:hypothetical protein